MKHLTGIFMGLLVATVMLAFSTGAVMAQEKAKEEKAKAAPPEAKAEKTKGETMTKVLFENDKFRVVETRRKPGQKNEMKERSDRVGYSFNAGKSRIHYADGKTEDSEFKAGEVQFRKAGKSQSENIGKTETHNLVITAVKK